MSSKLNKISRETENKRKHLEAISAKKKTKKEATQVPPTFERNIPSKKEKDSFLIICEGKNTEPDYFNHFKLKSAKIKAIGEGYNTLSLVERAAQIVEEEKSMGRHYNQVWCVFDKDDFDDTQFNSAITTAENTYDFKVAYSNQSFEYWLILHFNDHQGGAMDRKDYDKKLNNYLKPFKIEYDGEGDKKISEDFFDILQSKEKSTDKENRQFKAIARAEKIYLALDNINPAQEESSTKVFQLVKEIMDNI
jgi:hypothetical protein